MSYRNRKNIDLQKNRKLQKHFFTHLKYVQSFCKRWSRNTQINKKTFLSAKFIPGVGCRKNISVLIEKLINFHEHFERSVITITAHNGNSIHRCQFSMTGWMVGRRFPLVTPAIFINHIWVIEYSNNFSWSVYQTVRACLEFPLMHSRYRILF